MKKWNLIGSLALGTMLLAACGDDSAKNTDKETGDSGDKKVLEMAASCF